MSATIAEAQRAFAMLVIKGEVPNVAFPRTEAEAQAFLQAQEGRAAAVAAGVDAARSRLADALRSLPPDVQSAMHQDMKRQIERLVNH